MPTTYPIELPGGFAPGQAVGFADDQGAFALTSKTNPMPVESAYGAAASQALSGTMAFSGEIGPFNPDLGRPIILNLSGAWEGVVQLTRSTDAGVTKSAVTAGGISWGRFSANACEQVWAESEAGAQIYLDVTLDSGTLTYRIAQ